MGFQDIITRIKKLESQQKAPDMVTLIYMSDGTEKRRIMSLQDATMEIMEQSSKILFGEVQDHFNRIIGVEYEDSDGFLEMLIDTEPIENLDDIVEV